MNEQKQVLIIVGLLLALGLASIYVSWLFEAQGLASDFTFYKSEIAVNGNIINEKLYYSPNEGYRDLFRNFISPVVPSGSLVSNAIVIYDVKCQQGDAYYYGSDGEFCTFSSTVDCDETQLQYFDFVERNEYGCTKKGITESETFFYPGNSYWIQAIYNFIPENLFEENGSYYLKFVAYSPGRHPAMVRGENLVVNGNVLMKDEFLANENVVLYIPVDKNDYTGANVLPLDFSKGEGTSFLSYLLNVRTILALLPSVLFYLVWLFLGKERVDPQLPKILTEYPKKRKGWEVALYFNTPFLRTGKEFFSSMLLELQSRKIVQVRSEKKKGLFGSDKLFIKILKRERLDNSVEEYFLRLLRGLEIAGKKEADGSFELNSAIKKKSAENILTGKTGDSSLIELSRGLTEVIKQESKDYFNDKGMVFSIVMFFALIFLNFLLLDMSFIIAIYLFLLVIILIALISSTTIMTKYEGNLYDEYERWQSFKRFMEDFTQLKRHPPEGAVMWGEYLTYATALGVADKVLDKLHENGMITETQYNNYHGIYIAGSSFSSSYSSSTGGGGGGMGGGGGGGGGGGR